MDIEIPSPINQTLPNIKQPEATDNMNVTELLLFGICAKEKSQLKQVQSVLVKINELQNKHDLLLDKQWKDVLNNLILWEKTTSDQQKILIHTDVKTKNLSISLLVACMNRENHLIASLPSWFNVPFIKEIIVVDYSSTKELASNSQIDKWIKTNQIKLIRVNGERYFNLGKAYNIAADFSTHEKILKIDCDHVCIDGSWLNRLDNAKYDLKDCYFLRGDWRFGHSMSGIFICDKTNFVYYREDLTGWGFEDLDLYRRMVELKPQLKEVIWPDVNLYINHLPHTDEERILNYYTKDKCKTNLDNRLICHQPARRFERSAHCLFYDNNIANINFTEKPLVEHIFCVTLPDKKERWDLIKNEVLNVCKFEAIDTRKNGNICKNYNLEVRPSTLTYKIYFTGAPGAVGCYLSHYLLWQKIVKDSIPYALIIEDDIDISSLKKFLSLMPIDINKYEFIQLNKRFSYIKPENKMIFHGTESYIVSLSGAEKLLKATHSPEYLDDAYHSEISSVKKIKQKLKLKHVNKIYEKNSIIAPADKFITMCCDSKADNIVKLNALNYPCIDVNPDYSAASDIDNDIGHLWNLQPEQIEGLIYKLNIQSEHINDI